MLVRRLARPLLASWFVAEGIGAVRHPSEHAQRVETAWRRVAARTEAPDPPEQEALRNMVKLHGAGMAVAGLMLGLGKAPRLAACTLAVLTLPLAAMDYPKAPREGVGSRPSAAERADRRDRFLRDLSLIGGAALSGLDRHGKPSLGWRMSHAKLDRTAELKARQAVSAAHRQVRAVRRQVKHATS